MKTVSDKLFEARNKFSDAINELYAIGEAMPSQRDADDLNEVVSLAETAARRMIMMQTSLHQRGYDVHGVKGILL